MFFFSCHFIQLLPLCYLLELYTVVEFNHWFFLSTNLEINDIFYPRIQKLLILKCTSTYIFQMEYCNYSNILSAKFIDFSFILEFPFFFKLSNLLKIAYFGLFEKKNKLFFMIKWSKMKIELVYLLFFYIKKTDKFCRSCRLWIYTCWEEQIHLILPYFNTNFKILLDFKLISINI